MTMKSTFKLSMTAIAASLLVVACGGGGGGDSTNTSTSPSASTASPAASTTLNTMPSNTYAAGSVKAAIATQLNAYRIAMGVGAMTQDAPLDAAADAHALYLVTNSLVSHDEISTLPNYYETTPLSRGRKAGASSTEWIAENAQLNFVRSSADANAAACVGSYLNSVYHLQGMTSNTDTLGIGYQTNNAATNFACVLEFGQTLDVMGTPTTNGFNESSGQQMATTTIAHSPISNETNVARTMAAESPNPAADLAAPGRPIMVRVNVAKAGDNLTVSSFTLKASDGSVVPARLIVPSAALAGSTGATADANSALADGVAFLLPLASLAAKTSYTASFSGQRTGTPVSISWSFTTGD
jgi:uncharacterized protein YkwD